jgi:hypothetical protein
MPSLERFLPKFATAITFRNWQLFAAVRATKLRTEFIERNLAGGHA